MVRSKVSPSDIRRMIVEERETLQEYSRYAKALIREADRMRSDGFTRGEINEGLMDVIIDVGKALGGGFIDTLKYQIALKLVQTIGLDPTKLLARIIANIIENADLLEIKKYIGEDACDYLPGLIVDAVSEAGVLEPAIDGFVVGALGIRNNRLADSAREALTNSLLSSDFMMALKEQLTEWICDIDMSEIIDGLTDRIRDEGGNIAGLLGAEPELA